MADSTIENEWAKLKDNRMRGVFIPNGGFTPKDAGENAGEDDGEEEDPSLINMDGDFKALQNIRKKKNKEKAPEVQITRKAISFISKIKNKAGATESDTDTELTSLRKSLFDACVKDDVETCRTVCKQLRKYNKTLADPELRSQDSTATALHAAIENNSAQVFSFFLKYSSPEFLMEDFDVSVSGIFSKKNALHILTEKGNAKLTQMFLDKIPGGPEKEAFLRKSVVVQIVGQRPRHLPPIHIAALLGNWEMTQLFMSMGVSVNHTNNKADTPILWASRWNHIGVVTHLIQNKADVNAENDKGSTPLYWAVRYGYPELTELLIKDGKANVKQRRKLGLEVPIVLAAALGYEEIVRILVENHADPSTKIRGDITPIHYAAGEGHLGVVQLLLDYDVDLNVADANGDTPLMYAAKGDHEEVVQLLLENGADLERKNLDNRSAWNYAMESNSETLLTTLLECYKAVRRMGRTKFKFPISRTPLHLAAAVGNSKKIKALLDSGVDSSCKDEMGNTFFHVAVRHNYFHLLKEFSDYVDFNTPNGDGDTCLHIACRYGHSDCIQMLIKKTKLGAKNKAGETALHVAVRYSDASSDHISELVTTMIKAHNWSLVNDTDFKGNTALHIAARAGNSEVIQQLSDLNLKAVNDQGDTPLHVAAKNMTSSVLDTIIDVFKNQGKPVDLNILNKAGDTPLHICCQHGSASKVRTLIKAGEDLAKKGAGGNSPLHHLVIACVEEPENTERYQQVFDVVCNDATGWWCGHQDLDLPDQESPMYRQLKRKALLFLLTQNRNDKGLSVLDLACKLGAKDILEQIFQVPDVFMFREGTQVLFDVTHVMPETSKLAKSSRKISKSKVSVSEIQINNKALASDDKPLQTCLDYITRIEPVILADQILALPPFFQIAINYWQTYQWLYVALMLIHITYMALLSIYGTEALAADASASSAALAANGTYSPDPNSRVLPFIWFLTWPLILLLVEMYLLVAKLGDACRRSSESQDSESEACCKCDGLFSLIMKVLRFIGIYLNDLSRITFSCFVLAWYILYVLVLPNQEYILAVTLIIGWMCAIVYTTGFQAVHSFTSMLGAILLRDIVRFLFIYAFVLLAFSFGFHALFQVSATIRAQFTNPLHTILYSFNLMLGMGETDFYSDLESTGRSRVTLDVIYVLYSILSTIVLLNLLIAMMNDSYTLIREREGTTWRVGSVGLALRMERFFGFLPRLLGACGLRRHRLHFDIDSQRWFLTVDLSSLNTKVSTVKTDMEKLLERLEQRMMEVAQAQESLEAKMMVVDARLVDMEQDIARMVPSTGDDPSRKKSRAASRAALSEMSRPALRPRTSRLRAAALQAAHAPTEQGYENKAFQQ